MQLYEVRGKNWCLPIMVCWHDVIAEVRLPENFPWLKRQLELLTAWLDACGEKRDGAWWIIKNRLEKKAVISATNQPEDVVEWCRQPRALEPWNDNPEGAKYSDPFIDGYMASPWMVINDPLIMEMIWCSLQKYMLHVLVNEHKPVDLFFVKLYPLMLRENWKEIALRREMRKQGKYDPNPLKIMLRGMADELANEGMTAYNQGTGICHWTIEAVVQPAFTRQTTQYELAVKSRVKVYGAAVADRLKRQLGYAIEVYSQYLKASAAPYLVLFKPGAKGSNGIRDRKQTRSQGKTKEHTRGGQGDIILSPNEQERTAPAVEAKAETLLPEVPVLQPNPQELRYSWKKTIGWK